MKILKNSVLLFFLITHGTAIHSDFQSLYDLYNTMSAQADKNEALKNFLAGIYSAMSECNEGEMVLKTALGKQFNDTYQISPEELHVHIKTSDTTPQSTEQHELEMSLCFFKQLIERLDEIKMIAPKEADRFAKIAYLFIQYHYLHAIKNGSIDLQLKIQVNESLHAIMCQFPHLIPWRIKIAEEASTEDLLKECYQLIFVQPEKKSSKTTMTLTGLTAVVSLPFMLWQLYQWALRRWPHLPPLGFGGGRPPPPPPPAGGPPGGPGPGGPPHHPGGPGPGHPGDGDGDGGHGNGNGRRQRRPKVPEAERLDAERRRWFGDEAVAELDAAAENNEYVFRTPAPNRRATIGGVNLAAARLLVFDRPVPAGRSAASP